MFRRRRRGSPDDEPEETASEVRDEPETVADPGTAGPNDLEWAGQETAGPAPRPDGPWDISEVTDSEAVRFDLGGVQLSIPDGAQVQLDVTPDGMVVPTVFLGEAAVQISAFAAPRRSGIWAEVRTEIAESLRESGGQVAETDGPLGVELHGEVPVELPDGSVGLSPARFVGVDGPRWFLRGLFTGEAVVPGASAELERAFRETVVVRGGEAMAPRDPLPVSVPRELMEAAEAAGEGSPEDQPPGLTRPADSPPELRPFERGPEITEVR